MRRKRLGFDPWVWKIPWGSAWQPTSVFLPGESYGQRSLVGCSPWDGKESDMTEWLSLLHFFNQTLWSWIISEWASQVALVVKNLSASAGNAVSISGSERSSGEGNGKPLQYSCLGNPMDRGAWWVTIHGVANSWTQLKQLSTNTHNRSRRD